ncbi:hypothetical protein HFP57_11180 [Parasphingopyxis algicola]|uniref:hypothetical protein n=1 Tax=Parasphingopyxis algicola TaxID=2026624 RepID=UPI0015A241C2|nr:hypothetical protein [Parasphingopyxis algicola]QLC25525.1 hypothetical protein HFP57_11180 [Parasphingopyxis algicola]
MPKQWWQSSWVLAVLCLSTALPVAVTSFPPLIDLYGHAGRYHIQAEIADNPFIQRNWAFHWALVANLGVDLLTIPLSRIMGMERAIWLIVLCIPPLMASGFLHLAKRVHGQVPATALAALPFALAYPFQFGFVNFWLGTALGFHFCALWLTWRERGVSLPRMALFFLPASLLTWIVHVYAWGILGILCGGAEIGRAWQAGHRNLRPLLVEPALRTLPLAAPLPLMLIWRSEGADALTAGWFHFPSKIATFLQSLRDQSMVLDIFSICLVMLLIYAALRKRGLSVSPTLGIPALAFFALGTLFPFRLFGSAFADSRLWPVALAVAILAIRVDAETGRMARNMALAACALILVRIAASTAGFFTYDRDLQQHLAALEQVERGARIVVLVPLNHDRPWRRERLEYAASLAIVRRDAFTNTEWDVPGAQLLRPLGGLGTPFNASPSHVIAAAGPDAEIGREIRRRIDRIPRDRFDYVWVIDFDPETLAMPTDLRPLYSDDRTILYRIERDSRS